jgi:hypothetical protein
MTLDALTLFGVTALSVMLVCYALERRSPWFTFGMALSCIAAGVYGFLQGAWPFGVLEVIWAAIAFSRWWQDRRRAQAASHVNR